MSKVVFNVSYTNAQPPVNFTGKARADYIAQRKFYNLTADYNYFEYSLNGQKVVKNANAEHYFTREGTNTGLFNMDGVISEEKKAELKSLLKDTQSPIWHGFISFDEETSLGFQTQENCIKFLRQTFGEFLRRGGFRKNNVELYCSLHDDTDNRHIHFAFFEREPLHCNKNGVAGQFRQGFIQNKIIDNYLVSANMHLSEHGAEYYTARDEAVSELNKIRENHAVGGTFFTTDRGRNLELNLAFDKLIAKLPKTGRLQYNAKEMAELRTEIDKLAALLIKSDKRAEAAHLKMLKQFARVENEVRELALDNKLAYMNDRRMTKEELQTVMNEDTRNQKMPVKYLDMQNVDYFERLKADYAARLGNIVLGICKDIKRTDKMSVHRKAYVNDIRRKVEAKHKRIKRGDFFRTAREVLAAVCSTDSANFLKSFKQIEAEIAFEQVDGRI
ncbi:MAG: relaxase MobL [Clostridia bacterium]|nr:relaxase MobL [Clostridia bacterium]